MHIALFKKIIICFSFAMCFFLSSSCGLETFYYLDPPRGGSDIHAIKYDVTDDIQKYFIFQTNESDNKSEGTFKFLGTEVYYKIYDNYSAIDTTEKAVDDALSSTNPVSSADKIITTYKYQKLGISSGNLDPLIPSVGEDRYIYIRLNDYGDAGAYRSGICVDDATMEEYDPEKAYPNKDNPVFPRRSINSSYGFNFNADDEDNNPLPAGTSSDTADADRYYSSSPSEKGKWYVDMYAVSVGQDESFQKSYSSVLHLGSVTIDESAYDK